MSFRPLFLVSTIFAMASMQHCHGQDEPKLLRSFLGDWKATVQLFGEGPTPEPVSMEALETVTSIGPNWVTGIMRPRFGGMDSPTQFTLGYDSNVNSYRLILIDSLGPEPILLTGEKKNENEISFARESSNGGGLKKVETFVFRRVNNTTRELTILETSETGDRVVAKTEFVLQPPGNSWCLLTIKSDPVDAVVYFDNKKWGLTEKTGFTTEGKFKVRVEKDGFDPVEQEIEVKKGEENTYSFKLAKKAE